MTEFEKYATRHCGISSTTYAKFTSAINNSLTPYITEERQLNVAQMDVFSRLMMDRIIFLGTAIDDYTANVVQAQLLFLEMEDSSKDIQIREVLSMLVSASTTPCSTSSPLLAHSAPDWPPLWPVSSFVQARKVCVAPFLTAV